MDVNIDNNGYLNKIYKTKKEINSSFYIFLLSDVLYRLLIKVVFYIIKKTNRFD